MTEVPDESPRQRAAREEAKRVAAFEALRRRALLVWITGTACASLGVLILSGLLYWASQTYTVPGIVASRSWKQTVIREDWTGPIMKEDWASNLDARPMVPPVRGVGEDGGCEIVSGSCHDKYHHTSHYACGESCHTHNGKMSCHTRWCDRRVYRSWCAYQTWEWRFNTSDSLDGRDEVPAWPEMPVADLQRLRRVGEYHVSVAYGSASYEFEPRDEAELVTWVRGQSAIVELRNAGWVKEVRHGPGN